MSIIEDVPELLRTKENKDKFKSYLIGLPVSDVRKKQLLIEWCKVVGVPITAELFSEFGLGG